MGRSEICDGNDTWMATMERRLCYRSLDGGLEMCHIDWVGYCKIKKVAHATRP